MFALRSFRIRLTRNRTFSLIELSVAVATMGILAAIAIPTYLGHTHNAQDKSAQSALTATAEDARALTVYNMGFFPPFSDKGSVNLVRNGAGEYEDLTNWNGANGFVVGAAPETDPSASQPVKSWLTRTGSYSTVYTQDLIPVDPNLYYEDTVWHKGETDAWHYVGLLSYDSDMLSISSHQVTVYPGSALTTLTLPLVPGDTSFQVADASGWYDSSITTSSVLALWPYVSPTAGSYDPYTYTRHTVFEPYTPAEGYRLWPQNGISGNTVTLQTPWHYPNPNEPDGIWPVGTPVANYRFANTYVYLNHGYYKGAAAWFEDTAVLHGAGPGYSFRWGTAYVRPMALALHPAGSTSGTASYAGWDMHQIDPANPTDVIQAWDVAPYSITASFSTGPNVISAAAKGIDSTQMMYASLSDSGVCWVVLDNLIGQRTYGKITGQLCWASLILPAQVTAASFADA